MSSETLLDKKIKSLPSEEGILYLCPGSFTTDQIEALKLKMGPGSKILFFDPKSNLKNDFQLTEGGSPALYTPINWRSIQRVKSLLLVSGLSRSLRNQLETFRTELINTQGVFWRNILTLKEMLPIWLKNLQRNLQANNLKFLDFSGKIDKPVLVVGAGTSLDELLEKAHEWRAKVFLIAVDTAIGSLLERELLPDLLVALESQYWNLLDFLPAGEISFPIVSDLSSSPLVNRHFGQPLYHTVTGFIESRFFERFPQSLSIPLLQPMGNVGLYGLEIAHRLSSKGKVYSCGTDFWFPRGKSHAKGSTFHKIWIQNHSRLSSLPGTHWHSDLVKMKNQSGQMGITSANMQNSAQELQNNQSLIPIGRNGLAEGIPLEVFTREILGPSQNPTSAGLRALSFPSANQWFENERRIWKMISQTSIEKRTVDQLREIDLLYSGFPDRQILPNLSTSFLNRLDEILLKTLNLDK